MIGSYTLLSANRGSVVAQLRDARVLITGGAGLVGSHIADQLIDEGVQKIVILDNFVRGCRQNLAQAIPSGKIEIVEGDILDRALKNHAWLLTFWPGAPSMFWKLLTKRTSRK